MPLRYHAEHSNIAADPARIPCSRPSLLVLNMYILAIQLSKVTTCTKHSIQIISENLSLSMEPGLPVLRCFIAKCHYQKIILAMQ